MRKPVLLILTNVCLLIAIFGLLAQSLFVVQRIAQAEAVTGQVWVQRAREGKWSPLASGATIVRGDVVRTEKSSGAGFKWRDGTQWKLGEQTQLRLKKGMVDSAKGSEISQFDLASGKVWVRGVKGLSAASRFEVETPTGVASAREGVWSVEAKVGATHVAVLRGEVEVSTSQGAEKATLRANQKAVVTVSGLTVSSGVSPNEFESQTSLVKPHLEVRLKRLGDGFALLHGETEAGNRVRVDGENVVVLGTGGFFKRVKLAPGQNRWKIESTDRHGETSSVTKSLDFAARG
ncbi:MAG: FecR family protein [Armatimonadetes bacterium]|nr:FecR family protein [Armatimonadota bacterium]